MKKARVEFEGKWVADYVLREVAKPTQLILLLHGYQETGEKIFAKLEPVLPEGAAVIAPNGLFPIPWRVEDGYRLGFSWYFYDFKTDEYFIDMGIARRFLCALLDQLQLSHLPKTIIGFSQGGYIAPFVAQDLSLVKQVIGVASRYLVDELESFPASRMDAVHGVSDEIVSCAESRESFAKMQSRGVIGEFVEVAGIGHRINSEVAAAVGRLVQQGG